MDEVSEEVFERYFVFAVIWSFAGTLLTEYQEAFSDWWRQTFEDRITWPFSGTVSLQEDVPNSWANLLYTDISIKLY